MDTTESFILKYVKSIENFLTNEVGYLIPEIGRNMSFHYVFIDATIRFIRAKYT